VKYVDTRRCQFLKVKFVLKETGYGDMNWIHLAQNWVQWRNLVKMPMNLLAPKKA
jgi:hypothetical protein